MCLQHDLRILSLDPLFPFFLFFYIFSSILSLRYLFFYLFSFPIYYLLFLRFSFHLLFLSLSLSSSLSRFSFSSSPPPLPPALSSLIFTRNLIFFLRVFSDSFFQLSRALITFFPSFFFFHVVSFISLRV